TRQAQQTELKASPLFAATRLCATWEYSNSERQRCVSRGERPSRCDLELEHLVGVAIHDQELALIAGRHVEPQPFNLYQPQVLTAAVEHLHALVVQGIHASPSIEGQAGQAVELPGRVARSANAIQEPAFGRELINRAGSAIGNIEV